MQDYANPIVDPSTVGWASHPRFPEIAIKPLITAATNPLASVNLVEVPPGGVIGLHIHPREIEIVYVLQGDSILTLDAAEHAFTAGQIVSIPVGLTHGLRNEGHQTVMLLTVFNPPLT